MEVRRLGGDESNLALRALRLLKAPDGYPTPTPEYLLTANDATVRFADITPDAHVLDIGCGAGHAVQRVGQQLTTGRVVGLDASPTMVRLATRRNRRLIAQGRATIAKGDVGQLPYPPASFDRILATHTVYFWRDLGHAARELRRVLKPDGLLVLGFGDPESMRATFPASVCVHPTHGRRDRTDPHNDRLRGHLDRDTRDRRTDHILVARPSTVLSDGGHRDERDADRRRRA